MGCRSLSGMAAAFAGLFLLLFTSGCQQTASVSTVRLLEHQAWIDFSGLDDPVALSDVGVQSALPANWTEGRATGGLLYKHRQWRSASGNTGFGVVHATMPLPLSARAVVNFAKGEYERHGESGETLGQWSDDLGREWFEARNERYYVRGYAITRGFQSWLVYVGYRRDRRLWPDELMLAARAAESVVPLPLLESFDGR